jgi:hypothetical protein
MKFEFLPQFLLLAAFWVGVKGVGEEEDVFDENVGTLFQ